MGDVGDATTLASTAPPSQSTLVASLETIKEFMLKDAWFPGRQVKVKTQSSGKGKGTHRQNRKGDKARRQKRGEAEPESPTEVEIEAFRWEGHERVLFLVFPNRIALRNGLTRLSVYLEDPAEGGKVVGPDVRPGKYVAASYTGHNFRPRDMARFAAEASAIGASLEPLEEKLLSILSTEFPEAFVAGGDGDASLEENWGCIATARGLNKGEVANTLLHESMHGLFYAYPSLREASWSFWEREASQEDRKIWRDFLGSLGYDSSNEELCVNEMLAYLCTEKQLIQRYSSGPGSAGAGNLKRLQDDFVIFVGDKIPVPKPYLRGQFCAFKP